MPTLRSSRGGDLRADDSYLELDRCPFCWTCTPTLKKRAELRTNSHREDADRYWGFFVCSSCGGVVTAIAPYYSSDVLLGVTHCFPEALSVSTKIPERAREYLTQAIDCLHSPAASIMSCASSVDAMLKAKGLTKGSLYERIDDAAEKHLITQDMSSWAHEVRLDANEQRHADEDSPLPKLSDAQRCVDFTKALGEFLFVLPAKVEEGRRATQEPGVTEPRPRGGDQSEKIDR